MRFTDGFEFGQRRTMARRTIKTAGILAMANLRKTIASVIRRSLATLNRDVVNVPTFASDESIRSEPVTEIHGLPGPGGKIDDGDDFLFT